MAASARTRHDISQLNATNNRKTNWVLAQDRAYCIAELDRISIITLKTNNMRTHLLEVLDQIAAPQQYRYHIVLFPQTFSDIQ